MHSLKYICLNFIVDNFERYHFVFSTSGDNIIKEAFEVLQRKFSFQIVGDLYTKNKIKDKYLDVLINRNLKVLDADWFNSGLEERLCENVFSRLPNLRVLCFRNNCKDEILKTIAKFCLKISKIDVRYSSVTDNGVKSLCTNYTGKASCTELKKLYIASTNVTEEGVKYLIQNLVSLEIIDYSELPGLLYSIHKNDLSEIKEIKSYNITTLNLLKYSRVQYFNDLLNICLRMCPRIKSLACPLLDEQQSFVFLNLQNLFLKNRETNVKICANIFLKENGRNLLFLNIHNCLISVSVLAKSCPRLSNLCLNKISFLLDDGDDDYDQLRFHNLKSCCLEAAKNELPTARAVRKLLLFSANLEFISFKSCVLTVDMKSDILKCCEICSIKTINISKCIVEMLFVRNVVSCESLKKITLDRCGLESSEEVEIHGLLRMGTHKPHVSFSEQISVSDCDDFADFDIDDQSDNIDDSESGSSEDANSDASRHSANVDDNESNSSTDVNFDVDAHLDNVDVSDSDSSENIYYYSDRQSDNVEDSDPDSYEDTKSCADGHLDNVDDCGHL